jgi:hypothetical protein
LVFQISHALALTQGADSKRHVLESRIGYAMIEAVAPFEVQKMRWGRRCYGSSAGDFLACLETAKKTGKDQRCSITAPAQ